ncbi:hypothetical protein [Evansella halocellulosilytica]|uniref:hypothetical protein n=1 Tax=Evansella halocellulosilytica TaxID=2011013 RepID=UPI000BB96B71|nr:hypothetical protein [Evansella halocellulosilytica]
MIYEKFIVMLKATVLSLIVIPLVLAIDLNSPFQHFSFENYLQYFLFFAIIGTLLMFVFGFPTTMLAGVITEKLTGKIRFFVNVIFHILIAASIGYILFNETYLFIVLTILVATIVIVFDEVKRLKKPTHKVILSLSPILLFFLLYSL